MGRVDVTRYPGTVGGAEAVGQLALAQVAIGGAVGILTNGASVLVRPVRTVRLLVAKELLVDTLAITTLKLTVGADGLVGDQVGLDLAGLWAWWTGH